ncbi:MAG TPA: PDDEXK nuclease domain-containing protein [Blastocatellia bacterium]|nr:PDDEXK nuclease domain-containing protein [Blastocatellia bacterium]
MTSKKRPNVSRRGKSAAVPGDSLFAEVRELIVSTRQTVARGLNAALVMLYWQIGARIRKDILDDQRAEYGKQILVTLSQELMDEFGSGYSASNLSRMVALAEAFPDREIVASLTRQLSWSHFVAILPLKRPLQREFYAEMCRVEGWSVRTLRAKIDGMLYERTALSKKPDKLIRQELDSLREEDKLTPDLVFKDPYFLDFLGLRDTYSEKDLESAILREIERFLLEMGAGFAFVERQKRIVIDDEDFYLDLLLYHRRLRRLVLVELKLGAFKAGDFGQTTLYLRWLDRHERQPGEESPMGLILCAGKSAERIELLELDKTGIRVAEYLTELPPKKILQERFHRAIEEAKSRLEQRRENEH